MSPKHISIKPKRRLGRKPDDEHRISGPMPHTSNQAKIVALQSQIGNAAVQRYLASAEGGRLPASSNNPQIIQTRQTASRSDVTQQYTNDKHTSTQSTPIQRGLFGKVWGGIKKGAKAVGRGVKKAAKAVGRGVKKGAKWVAGAAKKVWSGTKWVGRQLWSKLKGIFYRVIRWIRFLPARLKRLFSALWNGVKSLKPWSLQWWASLGRLSTWKNFLSWLGETAIYILEAAGIGEVYETIVDILKFNTRELTAAEIAKAKLVFSNSIDYTLVRVDERGLIGPSWTKRAYVSFHTINAWGGLDDHTLIHELTHAWQYEKMGAIYMPLALHAQSADGYEYGGIDSLRKRQAEGEGLSSFNLEQQGDIMADYYSGKMSGQLTGADLATYEHFVKYVR